MAQQICIATDALQDQRVPSANDETIEELVAQMESEIDEEFRDF